MLSLLLTCLVWSSTVLAQASTVKIFGDVPKPLTLTASDVASMPRTKITASAHKVTGADGYRVSFALVEFDSGFTDRVAILADRKDGMLLGGDAAPFQVILADEKRPARWVRQVVSIEVRAPR